MTWAKPAFSWLAWLFLIALGIQFFLAGIGVFGGGSIEPHKGFAGLLSLIAVLMVIVGFLGKMGGKYVGMSATAFILIMLQYFFASETLKPMWLRSFHVFDAFLLVGIAMHLAQASGFPMKKSA